MSMANEAVDLSEKDETNFFIRVLKYFIPWKGDGAGEVVRKIVFMGSIAVFCFSLGKLSDFLKADEKDQTYMQEIVSYEQNFTDDIDRTQKGGIDDIDADNPEASVKHREIQDWAKKLLERNEDVIGWIKIPGFCNSDGEEYINFPVLQGEDNEYYLYKNLDKQYYESGSIYADAWATITPEEQSDNITIYGHHMRYLGTSFTHLTEYKKGLDFMKKYPVIEFNTIYESGARYVIVGVFCANIYESQDEGNVFEYWTTRYFDDSDYKFEDWISEVRKRSWYSNNIECTEDDKYISLSTCTNETSDLRWVIVAKKMTAEDNLDLIVESYKEKANKDIYFPKCWRDLYGNNKKYFGWDY